VDFYWLNGATGFPTAGPGCFNSIILLSAGLAALGEGGQPPLVGVSNSMLLVTPTACCEGDHPLLAGMARHVG